MIDMNKKYTYNGKPVRIYADGSDTYVNAIHGAIKDSDGWVSCSFNESDLVEVWEPKEGEWCFFWNNDEEKNGINVGIYVGCNANVTFKYLSASRLGFATHSNWDNCAPFTGTLPEAFKGL